MATQSASLPIERSYLAKAWLAVAAIVVLAVAVVTIALASAASTPPGGSDLRRVSDAGQVQEQSHPIVVNGSVCGQCR